MELAPYFKSTVLEPYPETSEFPLEAVAFTLIDDTSAPTLTVYFVVPLLNAGDNFPELTDNALNVAAGAAGVSGSGGGGVEDDF